jgi:hypothetical protein
VQSIGIPAQAARMTSDRHFTISYRRPAATDAGASI